MCIKFLPLPGTDLAGVSILANLAPIVSSAQNGLEPVVFDQSPLSVTELSLVIRRFSLLGLGLTELF